MKLIGLTGGIGCGKTTVVDEFQKIGIPCFVADRIAGSYYNEPLFAEKIEHLFGKKVMLPDGAVDKRALARIVFNDSDAIQRLSSLVHPRVMNDFTAWASKQQSPYVIMESAILYEYHLDDRFDAIVTVYLEYEECLNRLIIRDRTSKEEIMQRMKSQMPPEQKMQKADFVVLNYEGNPRSRQVAHIDRLIRTL